MSSIRLSHVQPDVMFLHSPHEVSERVGRLQASLKKHGWYTGQVDHEFGILTYQAVYRAKYWLGYLNPDHRAGEPLLSYLDGTKKPSVQMRATGALRRSKVPKVSRGALAVREALTHLGTKESPPNSNNVLFSRWYGMVGAWCAMFVSFCMNKVGFTQFQAGRFAAYVPFLVDAARRGSNGLTVVHFGYLQDGDIVCYDWPGESPGVADHTGLFVSLATLRAYARTAYEKALAEQGTPGANEFWAVEGNTSFGDQSDGGEVMLRRRSVSLVQLFARAH